MPERPSRLVLLGHPVAHSLSPAMHGAALRAAGIELPYEALDVEPGALVGTMRALAAERAAGNVTIPYKEAAGHLCGRLTTLASRVGAVNTFWTDDAGLLVGDNTDVGGFGVAAAALLGASAPACHVALIGAGGSAASVLAAISKWPGATAAVWSRSPERAAALAARFSPRARPVESLREVLTGAALVVNATPIGLADDAAPVPIAELPRGTAVLDLVYRRGETPWVRAARAAGHHAADGLGMLVEQGALSFERWFGIAPDREAMWAAVR